MSLTYGTPARVSTDSYIKVIIIQTDIEKMTAKGQSGGSGGPVYSIDLSKYLGEFAHHPNIGEEWIIFQIISIWVLFRRTNFQNNATIKMLESNPGDTVFDNGKTLYITNTQVEVDGGALIVDGQSVSGIPAGVIQMWGGSYSTVPVGWLPLDGRTISRTDYSNLFANIGTIYGNGDGSTTFNIPNMSGGKFASHAAPGSSGGGSTHLHNLSDNGMAQVVMGTGVVAIRRISNPSGSTYSENFRMSGTNATPASNQGSGAGLTGTTDLASSLPPWLGLLFMIKY